MRISNKLTFFLVLFIALLISTPRMPLALSQTFDYQTWETFVDPLLSKTVEASPNRLIVMFDPSVNIDHRVELLSSVEGVEVLQAYKIIPGVLVNASQDAIESIESLGGVKEVWLDRKVEVMDDLTFIMPKIQAMKQTTSKSVSPMLSDSVRLINAPDLWELGINGSGVIIAVVDTGINWHHESLDDLDDDPTTHDPKVIANVSFAGTLTGFDDHGHGTHVAGIAAGTGGPSHTYMGVAPGARLYAVKVLTSGGWGYMSWVISGIEWSVEKRADIVTLSLGGWGYPHDPLCKASDAAVEAGVVVTVAAGNDYYYWSVASPGLAKKVITVGASTKADTIAAFSSKGPNNYDWRCDPDVVAPGVGIMSADAFNETNYIPASGTSMSTPHVAGAAALLLQAFPDATPELITSALMTSAVDLGADSYSQGAGRIDVLGAHNLMREAVSQGILNLKLTSPSPQATRGWITEEAGDVSLHYTYFGNARIEFWVDEYGNVLWLVFDGRPLWAVMAWRLAYNESNYGSWELEIVQSVSMVEWNETYQRAFGSLRTPDANVAVFVVVELFGDEPWARVSIMAWPIGVTLENLRIFYIEDVGMYYDYGYDHSHYYASKDVVVVNDTREPAPAQHFGFGGNMLSSAHHLGEWPSGWYAAYYDELNNVDDHIGDDNNVLRWSLGKVDAPTTVSITFGLGYSVSDVFNEVDEGRLTPLVLEVTPYPELSVSITGPTMAMPERVETYTVKVSNRWIGSAKDSPLKVYVDETLVKSFTISAAPGSVVEVQVNVSMLKGLRYVKAEIQEPLDPVARNNVAKKKVFVGIPFSAITPAELEVYTLTYFGPFANFYLAWVNLTIITPALMPNVQVRVTGNLSQVIAFVDPSDVGDVKGWRYFAFEVYASGYPLKAYKGSLEFLSDGVLVNAIELTVIIPYHPVPKVEKGLLNDTWVLRVTETLRVTVNATARDAYGEFVDPSKLTVNIYLLYYDEDWLAWFIMEWYAATYNPDTGLFEFNRDFSATFSLGEFGIGIEVIDPDGFMIRSMPRVFYVENNLPRVWLSLYPSLILGGEAITINVTVSDVETPIDELLVTLLVRGPKMEKRLPLTLKEGVFVTEFYDTEEEGTYLAIAMATDADGDSEISADFFSVDNTPPLVNITSPMAETIVSGILNVAFLISDPNLKNASILVEGFMPMNVTGLALFELDTTAFPDGNLTIRVSAQDLVGNVGEASVVVIVDNTIPIASIHEPREGEILSRTYIIKVYGYDANFDAMELYVDGSLSKVWEEPGTWSHSLNTLRLSEGPHSIVVKAYDKAGNDISVGVSVVVDNIRPLVRIENPRRGEELSGIVRVVFTAMDDHLESVQLMINDETYDVTGKASFLWDTSKLADSYYTIKIVAQDKVGNEAEASVIVFTINVRLTLIKAFTVMIGATAASVAVAWVVLKRRRAPVVPLTP